jgi:hypothetical protein
MPSQKQLSENALRLATRAAPANAPAVFDDRDVLFTTPEAAAYLRKHPVTLERWRREGSGPQAMRVGQRWFYRLSVLREFTGASPKAA